MKQQIVNDTQYRAPVFPDGLYLDAKPTVGSFNAVTSDGVAKAIAQGGGGGGGGGASYTAGNGIAIDGDEISVKAAGGVSVTSDGVAVNIDTNNLKLNSSDKVTLKCPVPTLAGSFDVGKFVVVDSIDGSAVPTYGLASALPTLTGQAGKVLTVNSGATGVEWASAGGGGAYIADFRNFASMTTNQKKALAEAIGAAAGAGTPVYAKFDSITGGGGQTPNARFVPLVDFYFDDSYTYWFKFIAPFDWSDSEDSYAPHRGLNVVNFYNSDWAPNPHTLTDEFFEGTFTKMNPAPHR